MMMMIMCVNGVFCAVHCDNTCGRGEGEGRKREEQNETPE